MAQRARSRWAALVAVLASALVIGGVGAYSLGQTGAGQTGAGQAEPALAVADQTQPTGVTSQEGDSDRESRGPDGNRRGNGQGGDIERVDCDEARNHGEYVSSVARSTPGGPGRGALVSAAARSDCGKPTAERAEESEAEEDD